jgi:hypothetical protein
MQDRVVPEKRGKNDDGTLANFNKQSTQQRREKKEQRERTQVGGRRAKPKVKRRLDGYTSL